MVKDWEAPRNLSYASHKWFVLALACTVESICSQSNNSKISFGLDSYADTCVVISNVFVLHDNGHFVGIYSFNKETQHSNACTVDVTILYEDPVMHLTVIIMINKAIKIDIMTNIMVCPIQYQVHGMVVNECPKFYLHPLRMLMPSWCMTLMTVDHPLPSSYHLTVSQVTSKLDAIAYKNMRTSPSPSNT